MKKAVAAAQDEDIKLEMKNKETFLFGKVLRKVFGIRCTRLIGFPWKCPSRK
jgi:hypothetical protein